MTFTPSDSELKIHISEKDYSEEVIYKCFYWYTGRYAISITRSDDAFLVSIDLKSHFSNEEMNSLIDKVKRDIIDFKLRNIVTRETKTIRELIVAKAFSHLDELTDPVTDISDPVGFNPNTLE